MINVSDEFKSKMEESRDFKSYAEITFPNGTNLTLDSSQFTTGNNSLVDGSGISSFPLGVAVQKNLQIEILNDQQQYADYYFTGAKIRYYIEFKLSETTERIEKGTYTVVTPETYGETVIITAYDDMCKADKDYTTTLIYPQTAGAVLRDICSTCDISLGSTSFLHDDFIIQDKPSGKFRDIIGYIAMIACGNARIDRRNYLQIISYDFNGFETEGNYHILSEWQSPKIDYNDSTITGFKTVIKSETSKDDVEVIAGTDSYMVTVENPLISGREETVLSWLLGALGNVPFRPFSGDMISNPLIEFMDLAQVKDRRGNLYNSFVTDINFLLPGYTTVKNSAPSAERAATSYSSSASKVELSDRKLIEKEKTDRELAIAQLGQLLAESSGMYITTEVQPDGSSIYYMHNKPTLDESDIVWKLTAEAFGISTDGGQTYPYGFTVTGEMITRLLYAEGINADYINTGAILIKDASGNTIFSIDMDTKNVIISGDSVRIGGKSAAETIGELEAKVDDAQSLNIILSNEYQGIPTDEDGNYSTFPDCSTSVTVLYGSVDVSSQATYTVTESAGVTASWDASTRTCTVTGLTEDSGYVLISAQYSGVTVEKKFTLAKQKQGLQGSTGYIVVLENEAQTIACDSNGSAVSGPDGTDAYITIPFRGYIGTTQIACSCSVSYSDLPSWMFIDSNTDATDTEAGVIRLYVIPGTQFGGSAVNGQIKLTFTINGHTVIKYFSWSKSKNGANGTDGSSGRTYYLSATSYVIKKDTSGTLSPSSITFTGEYRDGTSPQGTSYAGRFLIKESTGGTDNADYTTVYKSTADESSYTYTPTSSDVVSVQAFLLEAGGTGYIMDRQTLPVVSDGAPGRTFFVQADASAITYDPDSATSSPSNVTFKSYYRDGDSGEMIEYPVYFLISWVASEDAGWDLYTGTTTESSHTQSISSILAAATNSYVRCNIYDGSIEPDKLLDSITIPFIANGKQGEAGKDAADMTSEEIFNKLTNNGTVQGLFMENDQIYINATYIQSGTLSADLIKGGTLKVGGSANTNGKIYVYNTSGTLIGRWDSDGIYVNGGTIYCKTDTTGASIYGGRIHMTHGSTAVGYIGTNYFTNYSAYKGLVFDLEYNDGAYMTWAAQSSSSGDFLAKFLYSRKTFSSYVADRLYLGCDLDVANYNLRNVKIQTLSGINGYTPFTGNLPVVTSITARSDGGIDWTYGNVIVRNGIITAIPT